MNQSENIGGVNPSTSTQSLRTPEKLGTPCILAIALIVSAMSGSLKAESYSPVFVASAVTLEGELDASKPASKFNYFSCPHQQLPHYQGIITSLDSTSITDSESILGDNVFDPAGRSNQLQLRLISGEGSGRAFKVTGNNADGTVMLAGNPESYAQPGNAFVIEPIDNINSLFGPSNRGSDFASGSSFNQADNLITVDPVGSLNQFYHFYQSSSFNFWLSEFSLDSGVFQIPANSGFIVRRNTRSSGHIYFTGVVPTSPRTKELVPGFNLIGTGAVSRALTLNELQLDGLQRGRNPAEADSITIPHPDGSLVTYFYLESGGRSGWYSQDYKPAGGVTIEPGRAFYVNRLTHLPAFTWNMPSNP